MSVRLALSAGVPPAGGVSAVKSAERHPVARGIAQLDALGSMSVPTIVNISVVPMMLRMIVVVRGSLGNDIGVQLTVMVPGASTSGFPFTSWRTAHTPPHVTVSPVVSPAQLTALRVKLGPVALKFGFDPDWLVSIIVVSTPPALSASIEKRSCRR